MLEISWLGEQRVREAIAAYYLDPRKSAKNRRFALNIIINPHREQYPVEFGDLPAQPPELPGVARIVEPGESQP